MEAAWQAEERTEGQKGGRTDVPLDLLDSRKANSAPQLAFTSTGTVLIQGCLIITCTDRSLPSSGITTASLLFKGSPAGSQERSQRRQGQQALKLHNTYGSGIEHHGSRLPSSAANGKLQQEQRTLLSAESPR